MTQFSTQLEILEDRTLMSGHNVESIETIAALFHQSNVHVTSATIVTHGFQSPSDENGDSLMPLAQSIRDRANRENGSDQTAWLLDYNIGQETSNVSIQGAAAVFDTTESGGATGLPIAGGADVTGDVVLLFDWVPESNELSNGWTEAAGDALFSLVVQLGVC